MLYKSALTVLCLLIFISCDSKKVKTESNEISKAVILNSPSDLKGVLINVSDSVRIELDELQLFQDSNDAVIVGKLVGTNILNGEGVNYNAMERFSEGSFKPLSSLSNFMWRIDDSTRISIDTISIRSFFVDSIKHSEIYKIVGEGNNYQASKVPEYCYLSITWACATWSNCPVDTITFSRCIGFPPLCFCTGFPGMVCNSALTVKCDQIDCSHPCTLIKSPGKPAIGCFCDI